MGKKLINFKIRLTDRYTGDEAPATDDVTDKSFNELFLPYHLRFVENHKWRTGDWCLLR